MRFGDVVLLRRGGHLYTKPGQFRYVRARYIGAKGHLVYCELLQDDPDAVAMCKAAGDRGWWYRIIMTLV